MNTRKLKKLLPGMEVSRSGKNITVTGAGLGYTIQNERGRSEQSTAEYLRSKIPVAIVPPQS